MSKVTMPDPVAKVTVGDSVKYEHIDCWNLDIGVHDLISTTQAEAYADARVRKALEEAALIVDLATQHHHVECWSSLEKQAAAIRALKPEAI